MHLKGKTVQHIKSNTVLFQSHLVSFKGVSNFRPNLWSCLSPSVQRVDPKLNPEKISYPHCVDLRTVLEEIPSTWSEFIPHVSKLFDPGQGVECAISLKQREKSCRAPCGDVTFLWRQTGVATEPLPLALSQYTCESTPHQNIPANPWRKTSQCNTATPHSDKCKWGYLPLNADL